MSNTSYFLFDSSEDYSWYTTNGETATVKWTKAKNKVTFKGSGYAARDFPRYNSITILVIGY